MFRVYINHIKGRVLISGRRTDIELTRQGWKVVYRTDTWKKAYNYARKLALKYDYILEWYLEEMITFSPEKVSTKLLSLN